VNTTPPYKVEVEDHRLELLMDYTTFHIGLYMTLTGVLIAADAYKVFPGCVGKFAVALFLIAGACGGIIAVNAAEFDVTNHKISEFFDSHPLDVWGFGIFRYRALAFIEHAAFWFGALTLVGTFLLHHGETSKLVFVP
jgi:hypothetical protein